MYIKHLKYLNYCQNINRSIMVKLIYNTLFKKHNITNINYNMYLQKMP